MNQPFSELPPEIAYSVLKKVVHHTSQAIFIFDISSFQIIYVNPAFRHLWQLQHQNVQDELPFMMDSIHEEDRLHVREEMNAYLEGTEIKDLEFRLVLPNQPVKWLSLTLYATLDNNGERHSVTGFAQDITKVKEYSEYLLKHNAKKNTILDILSHDLKGPIAIIQSISSLLEKESVQSEFNDTHNLVNLIGQVCQRAMNLIKSYVSQEFLESTDIELIKSRIDVVERIKSVITLYKASQEKINKFINLESVQEKLFVQVDDVKFMQMMTNLISNAIKFTPDNGTITIRLEEKDSVFLVAVADTGIGIPEKVQPFLFDKFTKARRPGIKGEESVGLGMSIIRRMVELHQGRIWFESIENKGTTFYVELPKG